jgi:ribosomal protein S12 methylthiotransferase accessory factor
MVSETSLRDRLNEAADALIGTPAEPGSAGVLRYLGYDDSDGAAAPGRVRMLRAGAGFRRLFRLPAPDAPGLVFFGGEADPAVGFAGSGLDARQAFEACVGEGIEYLSQFAQPDDPLERGAFDTCAAALDPAAHRFVRAVFATRGVPTDRAVDWIRVRRLTDGGTACYPADLCLRRPTADFDAPLKLSTGCAAGVTLDAAMVRGLLELIERDAVALWWRGGRRARAVVQDSAAGMAAVALLVRLRRGRDRRQTTLLDITTDLGIPVVAAFSVRPDGYGFALGMAARTSLADAARSAIFEMCQSELSLRVIATKRLEAGEAALNESDRRQHARATLLDARDCVLLHPDNATPPAPPPDPADSIVQRLAAHGIVAYSLDLTRTRFDVPVVRVIAPGLQLEPCGIINERLAQTIAETGGGARHTGGVVLL